MGRGRGRPVGRDLGRPPGGGRVVTGQFASAVARGELWTADGGKVAGRLPAAPMNEVCNVGPQDRRIRGSIGVFDAYHGWNGDAQFPAIWSLDSSVHQRHVLRTERLASSQTRP